MSLHLSPLPHMPDARSDTRARLISYWVRSQLRQHPSIPLDDPALLSAAREQTNAWITPAPSDRLAWIEEEQWRRKDVGTSSLYARLALLFMGCDDEVRNGVIVWAHGHGDMVLGIARERGAKDDYTLYEPRSGAILHFATLDALCDDAICRPIRDHTTIYWPSTYPDPEPKAAETKIEHPTTVVVMTQLKAKKKPSAATTTTKKRATASTMHPPASPTKKTNTATNAVELIEESSENTTAK